MIRSGLAGTAGVILCGLRQRLERICRLLYREGGEMHERGGAAVLVESVVFTEEKMQAMGIPAGTLPIGWWIGFKVTDEDVWEKVKDGTYPMFSIEGEAERVEVEDENTL